MVLEALAAVGLAGNIVQFLDFSCKLFSTAASIQHSYAGSSEGLQDVETVTLELQRWCVKIPGLVKAPGQQLVLQRHKSLLKLAENCETAATDLLAAVQSLKAKKPKSKWSCFKAALATIWKESQINDMEKKLDSYRQQLLLELALLQSDDNKDVRSLLDNLGGISRRMGADITSQISELGIGIRDALETIRKDLEKSLSKAPETTFSQDLGGGRKSETVPVPHEVHAANLADCPSKGSDIMISLVVLESLTFEKMHYRYDTVLESHPETFEWVFASKFQSWLKSPDPIFWISGKPGSGKSTMMKKLVDHPKTLMELHEWSGSHRLVIVDYFFWVNGTDIQRSQEGLLRALLYDILRKIPNLISYLLPLAWTAATDPVIGGIRTNTNRLSPEWSRRSLLEAFERLSTVQDNKTKFCVFIDGLDEYDGDHEELIQTIRHLTKAGIKLCVASRPWNVFEEAFGSDDARKIYMQHLNTSDIQKYVHDKLMSHPNFQRIDQDSAAEMFKEIIEKSQGVFLWVRLVVRSLTEDLRNRDSITLLRKRLEEFPSDLDQFFRHIFFSLETVYRSRLSHMFQITLKTSRPLSPVAYWILDEIDEKPDLALTMSMQNTLKEKLSQITDEITSRINGRSKGLLEVTLAQDPRNNTVDFLHRTVKDFFMTTDIQQLVAHWQHPQFDPHLAICKIVLAEINLCVLTSQSAEDASFIKGRSRELFRSAHEYEVNTKTSPMAYLVKTEQFIIKSNASTDEAFLDIWGDLFAADSFLEVAVSFDLCVFMAERIKKKSLSYDEAHDCLRCALSERVYWNEDLPVSKDPDGIPKIIDVILSGSSKIKVDDRLLNYIVAPYFSPDSDGRLSLAKRFIKHSIISSSILEDVHFKEGLNDDHEDDLKTAYSRHWNRPDPKSIKIWKSATRAVRTAKSNQSHSQSSIRRLFRKFG